MSKEIANYTPKNIRDFTSADTLYIRKMKNGHSYDMLCKFTKFEKGIVHGEIIGHTNEHANYYFLIGTKITSRLDKCSLWGKTEGDTYEHCLWFKKDGFAK